MTSRVNLEKFIAAHGVFREVDEQMKWRTIEVFLRVAENNGEAMPLILSYFDFQQPVLHRHIGRLSTGYKKDGKRNPGLGLVTTVEDYDDYRSKRVYLTEAGIALYSKFHNALKGGFENV